MSLAHKLSEKLTERRRYAVDRYARLLLSGKDDSAAVDELLDLMPSLRVTPRDVDDQLDLIQRYRDLRNAAADLEAAEAFVERSDDEAREAGRKRGIEHQRAVVTDEYRRMSQLAEKGRHAREDMRLMRVDAQHSPFAELLTAMIARIDTEPLKSNIAPPAVAAVA